MGVDGEQLIILHGKVHRDDGLSGQHLWFQLHELLLRGYTKDEQRRRSCLTTDVSTGGLKMELSVAHSCLEWNMKQLKHG